MTTLQKTSILKRTLQDLSIHHSEHTEWCTKGFVKGAQFWPDTVEDMNSYTMPCFYNGDYDFDTFEAEYENFLYEEVRRAQEREEIEAVIQKPMQGGDVSGGGAVPELEMDGSPTHLWGEETIMASSIFVVDLSPSHWRVRESQRRITTDNYLLFLHPQIYKQCTYRRL